MRFTAASPNTGRATAGTPTSSAEFNAAWGATEPAPLDAFRTPAPFEPAPVHGWAVTMPAVLENPPRRVQGRVPAGAAMPPGLERAIDAQPFREAMDGGLVVREVDEPALFRIFFSGSSPSDWTLEPMA